MCHDLSAVTQFSKWPTDNVVAKIVGCVFGSLPMYFFTVQDLLVEDTS